MIGRRCSFFLFSPCCCNISCTTAAQNVSTGNTVDLKCSERQQLNALLLSSLSRLLFIGVCPPVGLILTWSTTRQITPKKSALERRFLAIFDYRRTDKDYVLPLIWNLMGRSNIRLDGWGYRSSNHYNFILHILWSLPTCNDSRAGPFMYLFPCRSYLNREGMKCTCSV